MPATTSDRTARSTYHVVRMWTGARPLRPSGCSAGLSTGRPSGIDRGLFVDRVGMTQGLGREECFSRQMREFNVSNWGLGRAGAESMVMIGVCFTEGIEKNSPQKQLTRNCKFFDRTWSGRTVIRQFADTWNQKVDCAQGTFLIQF